MFIVIIQPYIYVLHLILLTLKVKDRSQQVTLIMCLRYFHDSQKDLKLWQFHQESLYCPNPINLHIEEY